MRADFQGKLQVANDQNTAMRTKVVAANAESSTYLDEVTSERLNVQKGVSIMELNAARRHERVLRNAESAMSSRLSLIESGAQHKHDDAMRQQLATCESETAAHAALAEQRQSDALR